MKYDATTQKCTGCKEAVIWMKTRTGKWIPVDVDSITTNETIFNPKTMRSHFSTCKFADAFRKTEKEGKA